MIFMNRVLEKPRSLRSFFFSFLICCWRKRGVGGSEMRGCLGILSFCFVRGERVIV